MLTLTVWCYQTPLGARAGAVRLRQLEVAASLEVLDALAVMWVPGSHVPRVSPVRLRITPHLDDVVMLPPLLDALLAIGTAADARSAAAGMAALLRETGIDQAFLHDVGQRFVQGSSSLLVLSGRADLDVVRPIVRQGLDREGVTLFMANLVPGAPARIAAALDTQGERRS